MVKDAKSTTKLATKKKNTSKKGSSKTADTKRLKEKWVATGASVPVDVSKVEFVNRPLQ